MEATTATTVQCKKQHNFNRDFYLYTDASAFGLGAILGQKDQDGNEFVISYASRLLKGAERNYSVTEKDLFSIL